MDRLAFRVTRNQITSDTFSVLLFHEMVRRRVKDLTDSEYAAGLEYAIRKYHLPQHSGLPDLDHISIGRMDYIAELVAEAVGQDRLSRGTMEIAQNERELEQSENQERNETA